MYVLICDFSCIVVFQPNLLTPGSKLVWWECAELPFAMCGAQAVVINGIVYVGGAVGGVTLIPILNIAQSADTTQEKTSGPHSLPPL